MNHVLPDGNFLHFDHKLADPSLPNVVFLNGLTQSTIAWAMVVHALGGKANVLVYDMVFQGQSSKDGPWRSFEQHADDLNHLLTHLQLADPVLVGLSYGGFVAQHYCQRFPEGYRSAFFCGTASEKTPHFEVIEESWWKSLEHGGYDLFADTIIPYVLGASYWKKPLMGLKEMRALRAQFPLQAEHLFKLMEATKNFSSMGTARESSPEKRHFVLAGSEDLLFPFDVQEKLAQFWEADLCMLEQVGHTLNIEAAPQLTGFLLNNLS